MEDSLKYKSFEENLEVYKQFLELYERNPTQKEMWWYIEQRKNFKKGKLSQEQINAILKVNPYFFEKISLNKSFDKNLLKYKKFKEENQRFPKAKEMQWIDVMKRHYKNNKLSQEKISAILKVNPYFFDTKNKSFEENLEVYKNFKLENQRFPIQKEMSWVGTMRNYFKQGMLSQEQINAILKVNPYFFEKISLKWKNLLKEYECFLINEYREPTQKEMGWHIEQRSLFNKGKLSQEKISAILKVNPYFFEKQSKIRVKKIN